MRKLKQATSLLLALWMLLICGPADTRILGMFGQIG